MDAVVIVESTQGITINMSQRALAITRYRITIRHWNFRLRAKLQVCRRLHRSTGISSANHFSFTLLFSLSSIFSFLFSLLLLVLLVYVLLLLLLLFSPPPPLWLLSSVFPSLATIKQTEERKEQGISLPPLSSAAPHNTKINIHF